MGGQFPQPVICIFNFEYTITKQCAFNALAKNKKKFIYFFECLENKIVFFFFPFCLFCGFQNVCWRNIYDCGSTDKFSLKLTRLAVSLSHTFFSFFFCKSYYCPSRTRCHLAADSSICTQLGKTFHIMIRIESHFSNNGGEFSCFCYSLGPKWLI